MRKRIQITVSGTLILTLSLAAGIALADSGVWTRADKDMGRQAVDQDLLLELPGRAEKQQAVASINPATGRVEKRAGTVAAEGQTGTFTAQLAVDGLQDTLTFRYTQSGDKLRVLPSPDLGYELLTLPDGRVLVEVAASIYRLDPQKRTLSVFLKGQTGTYRKTAVSGGSAKMVVWGQRASLSPDGTKLLYWTTRNIKATGNEDGENWVKDLRTGTEKKIYGAGYPVLGWDADNRFYLDLGDSGIVQVDSASGASAKLVSGFSVSAVSSTHLLAQTTDGSLNVRDLSTGKQQIFRGSGLYHLRSAAASDRGPWFALVNAPDRSSRVSTLMLLNAQTLKSHTFEEPAGSSIIGVSWQDEQTLLVQTRNRTTAGESTYVIDIAEEVSQ